jgi:hypothetical protein
MYDMVGNGTIRDRQSRGSCLFPCHGFVRYFIVKHLFQIDLLLAARIG